MDWTVIAQVAGPTGVVAIFLIYWVVKNRQPQAQADMSDQLVAFQASVMRRLEKLEQDNEALVRRNAELELKIQALQYDLALMESAHQDLPLPMWLKDEKGVVLAVNRAYEVLFLLPMGKSRSDYIGHSDDDVWGPEIGAQFRANDDEVFRTGKVFNSTETFPVSGVMTEYHIIKYTRFAAGQKIGIAGIAIPPKEELMRLQ